MRSPRPIISSIACLVMMACAGSAHAQFGIGLYKDGQLIDTFGAAGPAGVTAPTVSPGKSAFSAVAPAVSAETQTRNQLFADSTMLGLRIQETLREMQNDSLANNKEKQTAELQLLSDLLQQLTVKQADVRAAFGAIGARLLELKLAPEILERHARAVASNEIAFATFAGTVNDVLSGKPGALPNAIALMDQIKLRDEPDLTRRGPTRQPMRILNAPEFPQEQASAAAGGSKAAGSGRANLSPPTGSDLAETPDVQLTSAIRAKAANLGNSPQAIYEFVRNSVKFQPYLGSRKGADFTLQQMAGNDTDQASLLIALLRAANIPCRYVRGTAEMTPAQATSWLGVDDLSTAANILATAGLNGGFSGGNVRCTRVWVEAYLPFSNYRGVPNDDSGKTWIPLDPAFKLTTVAQGEDVLAAMGYTNDAFLASYISTYNSNSPIQALQLSVQNWLNTNRPGTNITDIERIVTTQPLSLGLLPASLPINAMTASDGFPSLHDTNRFKIRFNLHNGGTTLINFTTNLCQLVGHKVTISYVGATSNDQATIDAHGGVFQTPPYLVNVKPVLKVDGNPVATATSSIGMGNRHESDMYFTQPAGDQNVQPTIFNDITAGNSQVIGFDTFTDVPAFSLGDTNPAPDALLMNLLHSTALDYLSRVDRGEEDANRLLRTVHTVDVSEDILESSVSVFYSFSGVPQTFTWTGMIVDADRRIIGPFAVDGNNSKVLPFMKLTGYDASFMESDVFEDTYAQRAVSTIRILQLSRDQGIPTCYITNNISSACPGFSHSSSVLNAVNSALINGHIVIIPRQDITVSNWSGTGYIDLNPTTGAAGYIISGGNSGNVTASGGATVDTWPVYLPCWFPTVSNDPTEPIKSYRNGFFGDTETDAFMACDEHHITLKGYFEVQCPNRPMGRQYFNGTTRRSIQEIADVYGPGEYELTLLTTIFLRFTIIKAEFKQLFETSNPANLIYNGTFKDDPPAIDRNRLFVVQAPSGGKYHASLDVQITPANKRSRVLFGIFKPGLFSDTHIASGPLSSNPANVEFPGNSGDNGTTYEVKVGVDIDADGELDDDEACPLEVVASGSAIGPPLIFADGTARYAGGAISVDAYIFSGFFGPLAHAAALLQIFRDGGPSGLPSGPAPGGKQPSSTTFVILNCFASSAGFSEWLTHNSGAPFSSSGSATIKQYTWDIDTSLAQYIAESSGLRTKVSAHYHSTVKPAVDAYFAALPVGAVQTFPSPGSYYSAVSSPTTVDFSDLAIGRGRLYELKVQYIVEKKSLLGVSYHEVTSMRVVGECEDLYDFNRTAGILSADAATLQIGHGNGSYGGSRGAGVIYRDKVKFDEMIANPF